MSVTTASIRAVHLDGLGARKLAELARIDIRPQLGRRRAGRGQTARLCGVSRLDPAPGPADVVRTVEESLRGVRIEAQENSSLLVQIRRTRGRSRKAQTVLATLFNGESSDAADAGIAGETDIEIENAGDRSLSWRGTRKHRQGFLG